MKDISLTGLILRLLTAGCGLANAAGNVAILAFGDRLLAAVGAPPPADRYALTGMACLSFTMGVALLLVARAPEKNLDLLKVAALGKSTFALATFHARAAYGLHWLWLAVGAFDALFAVVFLLYTVRLVSRDLAALQEGRVLTGLPRAPSRRALILTYSLTGTGEKAVQRVKLGLERTGYRVDVKTVRPLSPLFRFPMSLWDFARITARAIFRIPARIAPLGVPADHPYDLVIVEAQTWLVGTSAPIEAIFQDPDNLGIFTGRDAAAIVVCRGAHRRNHAMLVRWLEAAGANVVGARGFGHKGAEPGRLFTLWRFLLLRGRGRVEKRYGLSDTALAELERFGEALGQRPRLAPAPAVIEAPEIDLAA